MKGLAYKDQPIKDDNVHISAPHMYGSVLEAMELRKGASQTVLHAGSGTGYLTCIVASILGARSIHYCVEIHKDVVSHAEEAIGRWKEAYSPAQKIQNINLIHGNALELDADAGECALGFDRIYIGAAVSKRDLPLFKSMRKPGGILVGPGRLVLVFFTG
jgi:protein-L-isoaspartate O-methyltransferase